MDAPLAAICASEVELIRDRLRCFRGVVPFVDGRCVLVFRPGAGFLESLTSWVLLLRSGTLGDRH